MGNHTKFKTHTKNKGGGKNFQSTAPAQQAHFANKSVANLSAILDNVKLENKTLTKTIQTELLNTSENNQEQITKNITSHIDQHFHGVHVTIGEIYAEQERVRRELGWIAHSLKILTEKKPSKIDQLKSWIAQRKPFVFARKIDLVPMMDLQIKPSDNGAQLWQMTGHDPHFICKVQHTTRLRPGHYRLKLKLPNGPSGLDEPKLYFDTSAGYNEAEVVSLNFKKNLFSGTYTSTFKLPKTVHRLRFDPASKPGMLAIKSPHLKKRHLRNVIGLPIMICRALIVGTSRVLWRTLPVPQRGKQKLKNQIFMRAPTPLKSSRVYQNWWAQVESGQIKLKEKNTFVPLLNKQTELKTKPAKLIAFYLPQFHAIPENDKWWGKGFTEWTNVRPAKPQFDGHYQPHKPGELGYYNLLDPKVQKRQVELAKLYGLGGFCFYFYWFGGKRLLEQPTLNYLDDKSIDFPFCLCWANENWSRRWDGLDSEILISQNHSKEDDLAFIKYISKYLKDDRYIRIDGKPLLIIYRPSDLPNAKITVERWRDWCRKNGVGEIYLAYSQSFERVDPKTYGLDAAIEFPPNNSAPPDVTDKIPEKHKDFGGRVYDWAEFVRRSENYTQPDYKLFRGVCPSWDNTARRKRNGFIQMFSTPVGYQTWLLNAITDTVNRFKSKDERLVFINAWNEWAEGAHLEPDQKYGYAWLEATRQAQVRANMKSQLTVVENKQSVTKRHAKPPQKKLAIIVHAFYVDVLEEILAQLSHLDKSQYKLFVTHTADVSTEIQKVLKKYKSAHACMTVENRGRDVLPFLKILPSVFDEGYEHILKVHTKKSKHREDGNKWRQELYGKLLSPASIKSARQILDKDTTAGLIGPAGHITPFHYYWGSNIEKTTALAERMGVEPSLLPELSFVAGTMFYARKEALEPLLHLGLAENDFDKEQGQIDGTMAHAVERALALSSLSVGLRIVDTNGADRTRHLKTADTAYAFAESSQSNIIP